MGRGDGPLLNPDSRCSTLVITSDGTVLGHVAFHRRDENTTSGDFAAVRPEVRRMGIEARLIDGVQQITGRDRLELTVDENRPDAQAFYSSAGVDLTATTRPYRRRL